MNQRSDPQRLARSAYAALREKWFAAVLAYPGSEILAVQILRNVLDVSHHDGQWYQLCFANSTRIASITAL